MRCLVLGASGYVGRRLVPLLRQSGHEVRCLIRASSHARPTDGHPGVEIVTGDVLNLSDVRGALRGVDAVYHLVHALGRADFPDRDRRAAHTVAEAAETAGVRRIVYLGGLQPSDPDSTTGGVSAHLASRAEVGQIFLHSTVPAAVLRASIIIGSGSTSFEMLRYLTQRVPIIPLPSWARHHTQPIAIADVLHYLVRSLALPDTLNRSFDIGGPDIVTYRQLIQRCARAARLPVPWSPPAPKLPGGLAAALCGVLTPIPPRLAAPLIESLAHNMVCSEQDITALLGEPDAGPTSLDQAITAASRVHGTTVELTNGSTSPARTVAGDPPGAGGPQFVTEHTLSGNCDPDRLWELITRIGGREGWHTIPGAWPLRGVLDHLAGGPGRYRGRGDMLRVGDVLDSWRIEDYDPDARTLVLRAEMKMPGSAILTMSVRVDAAQPNSSTYFQRLAFAPTGLVGHLYWWAQRPAHDLIFNTMARKIVRAAEGDTALAAAVESRGSG